jgi:hypothetical protein
LIYPQNFAKDFQLVPFFFGELEVIVAAVLTEIGHFIACIGQPYKLIYSLEPNKCQYGTML